MNKNTGKSITGCLLGTAVGDALGLPMEGLSRQRQPKLFPDISRFHLLPGRGMVSDDTEHICMVADALACSGGDERLFRKALARRFRRWFLCLPAAIGLATLRAMVKLWLGFRGSGVFSAGNGPAMRSAVIGVYCGNRLEAMKRLTDISTTMTHTDPKARYGAFAVALAASRAAEGNNDIPGYLLTLENILGPDAAEFLSLVRQAAASVEAAESTPDFAGSIGLEKGVGGYIYFTVPVVLHAWFSNPHDYVKAVTDTIRCGGDTDTTAAILGGILGAGVGKEGLPKRLMATIRDWPLSPKKIEAIAAKLAKSNGTAKGFAFPYSALFLRNLFFIPLILAHGFRRLFPPY
ncbi:MAG: ADP-ribosylglycohydrolase family protein [bacterium]|nr:ADP-ribosylglycohydrolase family protein [bacterium]